jgi:GTPase KRas protein
LTLRLVRSQWTEEYDPTIEDSYSVTRSIDGRTFQLNLVDTAGQEEYRGLWAASNLKSDAFLLVYDITNAASLDALESFRDMLAMEEDQRTDKGQVPPVMIIAGNKCDLQHLRTVSSTKGLEWARSAGYGFMETSAREMVNVEETFARKNPSSLYDFTQNLTYNSDRAKGCRSSTNRRRQWKSTYCHTQL